MAKKRVGIRNGALFNQTSTLWNNLLAYYTGDGTSDDALGNYNGTLVNGATYGTGKINQGFSFDGVNDYVNLGDNLDIGLDSWTYNFWINMDSINRNNSILTKSDTGNNWERWWYIVNTSNKLEFHLQNNGGNNIINRKYFKSTQTLSASTWYMVTIVLDRTDKAYMYINGTSETIVSTDGNGTTITNELSSWSTYDFNRTFNCCIGNFLTANFAFDGIIDEGCIWNRALTSSEVTELYNNGNGKQYTPPVVSTPSIITDGLVLNLDAGNTLSYPGTGTDWFDLTSNNNNGVLTNGVSYLTDNGGVMSFDAINDYVDMYSFGVGDDLSDYTFCVWSKNSDNTNILTKGRDGNGNGWSLTIGTYNNQFRLGAVKSTGGIYGYLLLGGTYQPNKWDYISGTWDSINGIISLYINGLFIDSYTFPGTGPFTLRSSTAGWSSGKITNNTNTKGQLSQIQIYNNVLTETQIQQNYNATKSRFGL